MTELAPLFNRAFSAAGRKPLLLVSFVTLLLCGGIFLFFRGLGLPADPELSNTFLFFPFFFSFGLLLVGGAVAIRFYVALENGNEVSFQNSFKEMGALAVRCAALFLPLILLYSALWVCLGLFSLIRLIPIVGGALEVLFSFIPFLFSVIAYLLLALSLLLLFFVTPFLALEKQDVRRLLADCAKAVLENPFSYFVVLVIAMVPTAISLLILKHATALANSCCQQGVSPTYELLRGLVNVIPFALILTPVLSWFFNFSTESYRYLKR